MGGEGEVGDNPEVFAWGTWNIVTQSMGQRMWEKHVWREVSPVLDISSCLKDIHLERLGSSRLHVEIRKGRSGEIRDQVNFYRMAAE